MSAPSQIHTHARAHTHTAVPNTSPSLLSVCTALLLTPLFVSLRLLPALLCFALPLTCLALSVPPLHSKWVFPARGGGRRRKQTPSSIDWDGTGGKRLKTGSALERVGVEAEGGKQSEPVGAQATPPNLRLLRSSTHPSHPLQAGLLPETLQIGRAEKKIGRLRGGTAERGEEEEESGREEH